MGAARTLPTNHGNEIRERTDPRRRDSGRALELFEGRVVLVSVELVA